MSATTVIAALGMNVVCAGVWGQAMTPVPAGEAVEIRPLRIAPILTYTSATEFTIGAWVDVAPAAGERSVGLAFDQGQLSNPNSGCPAQPVSPRYVLIDGSTWETNTLSQNDITGVAPGAEGALIVDWQMAFQIHATSDFMLAAMVFEDLGPNASCAPAASSFLGGVLANFGLQTASQSQPLFLWSNIDGLPPAGINIPLPADGVGTYQYVYGRAFDGVTLTLHTGSQPALWCDSQWGGEPGRPGSSEAVGYWDTNQSGAFELPGDCLDTTRATTCCAILEPTATMAADFDAGCACSAHLTPSGGCETNTNDFFAFLALYQAQDPQADFSPGGGINTNDFFAYLAAYQADLNNPNCPG